MKRALFGLFVAALLTACAPAPEETPVAAEPAPIEMPTPETPAAPTTVRAESEAACAEQGGDWRPVCRMQRPACVTTFDDGGKACSDGSECGSGRCLADGMVEAGVQTTGTCAPNDDPCGCSTAIVAGVTEAGICVD